MPVGLTLRGGVFSMHTSREERERAGLFCFVLQPFKHILPPTHPVSGDSYTRRRRSSYAYQRIGQPACVCFSFVLPPFASHVMGGWGGGGSGVSLLSTAALLVCMPADREGKCVGHCILLRFHHSIYTDWVGDGTVSVALNLRVGACSMYARGSGGSRARRTFGFSPLVV